MKLKKYQIDIFSDEEDIDYVVKKFEDRFKVLDVSLVKETRTSQQNKALHEFFGQLADALNEKHCDMRAIIKPSIEIEWSKETVKEFLWKPLQKYLYGTDSTKKLLATQEISTIYDYIVKIVSERTKGEVIVPDWPSKDNINYNEKIQ